MRSVIQRKVFADEALRGPAHLSFLGGTTSQRVI